MTLSFDSVSTGTGIGALARGEVDNVQSAKEILYQKRALHKASRNALNAKDYKLSRCDRITRSFQNSFSNFHTFNKQITSFGHHHVLYKASYSQYYVLDNALVAQYARNDVICGSCNLRLISYICTFDSERIIF